MTKPTIVLTFFVGDFKSQSGPSYDMFIIYKRQFWRFLKTVQVTIDTDACISDRG